MIGCCAACAKRRQTGRTRGLATALVADRIGQSSTLKLLRAGEVRMVTVIIGALYHVIPHLNAAGRILLEEIPDAFAHLYHPSGKSAAKKAKGSKVRRAG